MYSYSWRKEDNYMGDISFVDVISWIWDHAIQILVVFSLFFEISKIKLNPITALMNRILRPSKKEIEDTKKELNDSIDSLQEEIKLEIESIKLEQANAKSTINQLIESNEMAEVSRIRWEIIEFSNSISNDIKHTKDEYRHIKDEFKRYHTLIEKYELDNGIIDEEMTKINERYEKNKNGTSIYF